MSFRGLTVPVLFMLIGLAGASLRASDASVTPSTSPSTKRAEERKKPASAETESDHVAFLHPGETLVFRLSWGIFTHAGQLRMETTEEEHPELGRVIRVRIHTKSRGLISAVFPVDSSADSYIDPATGRPLLIERSGREGDREAHTTTVYNYETMRVTHTDHNRPKRSGEADLPDTPAYDSFVAMMLARTWHLQPGDKRVVYGSFEDDIYELEATALEEDRIKTPSGRYDAVEIELKQLGELKGFFKKGGRMRFFISQDENPQIVRIELRANAGTFAMQLEDVEHDDEAEGSASDRE